MFISYNNTDKKLYLDIVELLSVKVHIFHHLRFQFPV